MRTRSPKDRDMASIPFTRATWLVSSLHSTVLNIKSIFEEDLWYKKRKVPSRGLDARLLFRIVGLVVARQLHHFVIATENRARIA